MSYVNLNFCREFCIYEENLCNYLPQLKNSFKCFNYLYEKDSIEFTPREDIEIKVLGVAVVDFVLANYDGYDSKEYIYNKIKTGNMGGGAFKNEECYGFIGFHDEGSMGMLVVLDYVKHQGIGTYLESFLIQEALKNKRFAFCQVHPDNIASHHLQQN